MNIFKLHLRLKFFLQFDNDVTNSHFLKEGSTYDIWNPK